MAVTQESPEAVVRWGPPAKTGPPSLAASERNPPMIGFSLDCDANIDRCDTPLIQSTLWGRVANARIFLSRCGTTTALRKSTSPEMIAGPQKNVPKRCPANFPIVEPTLKPIKTVRPSLRCCSLNDEKGLNDQYCLFRISLFLAFSE